MAGRRSKLLILVALYFAYLAVRGVEDLLLHDRSAVGGLVPVGACPASGFAAFQFILTRLRSG